MALDYAEEFDAEGLAGRLNDKTRDELLNETLLFTLYGARQVVAEWVNN